MADEVSRPQVIISFPDRGATAARSDAQPLRPPVEAADSPWRALIETRRPIAIGVATAVLVLVLIEVLVFRSGAFTSHIRVANPDSPAAKLALLAKQPATRVVYIGDSTILTDLAPQAVVETCADCGPGFNAGFSSATPWLTAAMARRVIAVARPEIVVIGLSPWALDRTARFEDSERARELLSPTELDELGVSLDGAGRLEQGLGALWSPYGQRLLIKEFLTAFVPGQRYNEEGGGLYIPPGVARSSTQLAAAIARMKLSTASHPDVDAPGSRVTRELISSLAASGRRVILVLPPLHPAALAADAAYLDEADVVARAMARSAGVDLIDCRSAVTADDFRDMDHLLLAGARKFSRCVGGQMASLLASHSSAVH